MSFQVRLNFPFLLGVVCLGFLPLATSLQCFKCSGASKEPYEDPLCINETQTQNCTGAENTCMTRIFRMKTGKPATYHLECSAKVDCERSGLGCVENDANIVCSTCCQNDLCNLPNATHFSTEQPSSGQEQFFPVAAMVFSLLVAGIQCAQGVITNT